MICVRLKGCAYGVKKKNPFKIHLNSDDLCEIKRGRIWREKEKSV